MKLSLELVKSRLIDAHKNLYDYSLFTKYINKNQKIDIICKIHGVFNQTIGNHLYHKTGCPICSLKIRKRIDNPILNFVKIHGDKYDYSEVNYTSVKSKIKIICRIHGPFFQTPLAHLRGSGCYECGLITMSNSLKKPIDKFIGKCNEIHGGIYDYSKVEYNRLSDFIVIICKAHGEFKQRAFSHQQGYGCSKCNKSRGERKIELFLIENKIVFEYNKHFDDCVNKKTLSFDFYISNYNLCIEYDGIQHFESIEYFGGFDKLEYQKKLDSIKNNWCLKNKINLIRIHYKDYDKIENILNKYLYKDKNELC